MTLIVFQADFVNSVEVVTLMFEQEGRENEKERVRGRERGREILMERNKSRQT